MISMYPAVSNAAAYSPDRRCLLTDSSSWAPKAWDVSGSSAPRRPMAVIMTSNVVVPPRLAAASADSPTWPTMSVSTTPIEKSPNSTRNTWTPCSPSSSLCDMSTILAMRPFFLSPSVGSSLSSPFGPCDPDDDDGGCFVRVVSKRFIRSAVTPRSGVFASAGLTATGASDDSRVFISCRVSFAVRRVRSARLSRVPSLCEWPSAEPRELQISGYS